MALVMIMTLSLLIYALGESHLRSELERRHLTMPDQKGRPTQRPTLRRIFQVFEGIHLLRVAGPSGVERRILNLDTLHRQILDLFGPEVVKSYVFDT